MVVVRPLKGIIYNNQKIDDLEKVMSPPYDIISEEMQNEFYNKHPNNFVRLILGKKFSQDSDVNNCYTRAKSQFDSWLKDLILIDSDKPAIFPYKIEYKIQNQKKIMSGFFILLKIDPDYKTVLAHERTLSKPKADRLNLMKACNANLEPIQLLYMDKNDKIKKAIDGSINRPIIDVKGYDNFIHRLWKLENKEIISMIQNELKDKILFIADGHHRYQTAINYSNHMKKKTGNKDIDAPFNYRLVILVNMFDEGLSILPTHRLIKKKDIDVKVLINKLKDYFDVIEKKVENKDKIINISKKIKEDLSTKSDHKIGMYLKDKYYILNLKDERYMDNLAGDRSKTWRTLDVSILHKIVLEELMGINDNNLEDHVKYTRVDEEAIKFVNEGKYNLSFLMNSTKIDELKAIAENGEHMPQKSTYFLPKMLSGLVMYKM